MVLYVQSFETPEHNILNFDAEITKMLRLSYVIKRPSLFRRQNKYKCQAVKHFQLFLQTTINANFMLRMRRTISELRG